MTDRELFWCIFALISAMLAFVSIVFIARPAHGSAVCLTYREARELWPKRHIYWYSGDHCWSNRRGPPRGVKYDLIRENHAEEPAPKKKQEEEDYCCWPPLSELIPFAERWQQLPENWKGTGGP